MSQHFTASNIKAFQVPIALAVATISAFFYARPALSFTTSPDIPAPYPAPARPTLSDKERSTHAYPPDILPGGSIVSTPYGNINVYEFGPEDGEKVLLLHGIATPSLALQDLAEGLVKNGCRVMIFDLFGRGYSDAPSDLPYDARLYISQILLALASSDLPWTGAEAFHLVGYSLGGAIAASFARYYPRILKSLSLITPSGLVRSSHVGFIESLFLTEGVLPEGLIRWVTRKVLTPWDHVVGGLEGRPTLTQEAAADFDRVVLSPTTNNKRQIGDTIWHQISQHAGFIPAYLGTMRKAPIYDQGKPNGSWAGLRKILETRRTDASVPGLRGGKVLLVLADEDHMVDKTETLEDAKKVLGEESLETVVLKGDHEIAITSGAEIAQKLIECWGSLKN